MRRVGGAWVAVLGLCGVLSCGDDVSEEVGATVATVVPIRGAVALADEASAPVTRAAAGADVTTGERSLARLELDSGPTLLIGAGARVTPDADHMVRVESGRAYAEVLAGDRLTLEAGDGALRLTDGALSVTVEGPEVSVYVTRGEVAYEVGEARGTASAGERLTYGAGAPSVAPEVLFDDWTGGLARPGPVDDEDPEGVGVLTGRVPDAYGQARWPLVVRRLDVRVRVIDDLAITEVDQEFFNPASETVEGLYRVRVPDEAVLSRFAVDRHGRMVDGYVREKAQARQAYEQRVYRGSTEDPALLEWDAPGAYRARIYPIAAGETRRVVIRYAEWLRRPAAGQPRLYRYPMGGGARAPHVQEFAFSADLSTAGARAIRAGHGARVEDSTVLLRRSDFRPRTDLWLELEDAQARQGLVAFRADHDPPARDPRLGAAPAEDESDYWLLPLVLPESVLGSRAERSGLDLVVVADVSAGTDRGHLELGRSFAESIAAHLGPDDRVAIVASDLTLRAVGEDEAALGPADSERVERLLDGLARIPSGGATDLGAAFAAAAELLDPARPGAVVYVGDGAPTVGELGAEGLLERVARLPHPLRAYAVGVGAAANLDLLGAVTRGGGLAIRVEARTGAADAALQILAHARRPLAQRVTVDVGTGLDQVFPRRPQDVVVGEVLPVLARVRDGVPTTVTVRGVYAGQEFEQQINVRTRSVDDEGDLRLRWAGERLRQLLLGGAGREEIADLGTRYGLITPYTSFYVPSATELSALTPTERSLLVDRPRLAVAPRTASASAPLASLPFFGVLMLAGCADEEPTAGAPSWLEAESTEDKFEEANQPASPPTSEVAAVEASMEEASAAAEPAMPQAAPMPARRAPSGSAGQGQANRYALEGPQAPPAVMEPNEPSPEPEPDVANAPADMEAIGQLMGDEIGENFGFGGLGLRGTGRGGGGEGDGTIGLGTSSGGRVGSGPERRRRSARPRGNSGSTSMRSRARDANDNDDRERLANLGYADTGADASTAARQQAAEAAVLGALRRDAGLADVLAGDPFVGGGGSGRITQRITVTTRWDTANHRARRCSDASNALLDGRRAVWRERLQRANGPSGWVEVYREARRKCETPTWRDRRALLSLLLATARSVPRMIQVHRLLSDGGARRYLRRAIRRRVRTPDDLRAVRLAFGPQAAGDSLIAQILERAATPAAKLRALRRLVADYPRDVDLALQLLEALERADKHAEARRLADRLRSDPIADAGVRTAIGEMFLRLGDQPEARRVFSEIVEFAPRDELARRRLGDLYRAHGWYEDAYRQYETLAAIRPDDPTVFLLLAQAAAGAGRVDEALRLEQRLAETAEPGSSGGVARTAILWSSVRYAELRKAAREASDEERLRALLGRMRRGGVLREAGDLRVSLVWSHPDARLSLWAGHPRLGLSRPIDITPELGIEVFDVQEQEGGSYRLEVRRAGRERLTSVEAKLVVVWKEGQGEEQIEVLPLTFDTEHRAFAWTLEGSRLAEAPLSEQARREATAGAR